MTSPGSLQRSQLKRSWLNRRFLPRLPGFFESPLRWYLALLLIGSVASISVGNPIGKFQIQRLVELVLALGLLVWCYRPEATRRLGCRLGSVWYGIGLLGFAGSALVASLLGPIPWISLGFLGLMLLQFGLMPLLAEAWQQRSGESMNEGGRMLALLAVALVGLDVGLWLIMRAFELQPYAWIRRFMPAGRVALEVPYLFLNSRWANQISLLLLWTFIPLLQQLQQGLIQRQRGFWWSICWAVPILCCMQIGLSRGDGASLAVAVSLLSVVVLWWVDIRARRPLWGRVIFLMMVAVGVALLMSLLWDSGGWFLEIPVRNGRELGVSPLGAEANRLLVWQIHLGDLMRSPLFGNGIQSIPEGSPWCGPHNIWVALLYWSGLAGTGFALLLTAGFVPWARGQWRRANPMTVPFLVLLFTYQLVDDIWLRPFSLAVLLVLLPSLLPADAEASSVVQPPKPAWLQCFALTYERYRLLALLGVLLILLSVGVPGGVGWGPKEAVSLPKEICLLFL